MPRFPILPFVVLVFAAAIATSGRAYADETTTVPVPGDTGAAAPAGQPAPTPVAQPTPGLAPPTLGTATSSVPLTSLLPSTTGAIIGADTHWLWDATAALRDEARYKGQISEAEAMVNVSVDTDILPWVGRSYIAFLPGATETAPPTFVVIAEIRDESEFATDVAHMKANLADRPHVTVTAPVSIDGVDVIHVKGPDANGAMLTIAVDSGWVIASTDGYAVRKLLDTAAGKAHNLSLKTSFADAFTKADGAQTSLWGVIDNDPVSGPFRSILAAKTTTARAAVNSKLAHSIVAFNATGKDTSLRVDTTTYVLDAATRALMDRLRSGVAPLTGDSLGHVPDETVASFIFSSPNKYLANEKQLMERFDTSKGGVTFDPGVLIAPYLNLFANFSGEVNTALICHNNQFGIFVGFQTDGPARAQASLTGFTNLLTKFLVPVQQTSGVTTMNFPGVQSPSMPLSPSLRASDSYFEISSARQWFDLPEGSPELTFPPDAVGATSAAIGSFKFLDQVLPMLSKMLKSDPNEISFLTGLYNMDLSTGSWSGWGKTDEGGATSSSTFILNDVDWKTLARLMTDLFVAESAKSAHPYHSPASRPHKAIHSGQG